MFHKYEISVTDFWLWRPTPKIPIVILIFRYSNNNFKKKERFCIIYIIFWKQNYFLQKEKIYVFRQYDDSVILKKNLFLERKTIFFKKKKYIYFSSVKTISERKWHYLFQKSLFSLEKKNHFYFLRKKNIHLKEKKFSLLQLLPKTKEKN